MILRKAGLIEDECPNKHRLIGEATNDDHMHQDVESRLKFAVDVWERTRISLPEIPRMMMLMKESLDFLR